MTRAVDVTTLALAFLAGLLTVLSPCVLPLLPIVLGSALAAHRFGALALAAGLAISFTLFGLFIALFGFSLDIDAGTFRIVAAIVMVLVGLLLMLPSWQMRLATAAGPVSNFLDRRFGQVCAGGQFAVGVLLGAMWSPCVGPTLGAASLLAAQGHDLGRVALTMLVFGIGAALPLIALGWLSRATVMRLRERLVASAGIGKMVLGAAFVVIGAAVASGFDKTIEAALVAASPMWLTRLTTAF